MDDLTAQVQGKFSPAALLRRAFGDVPYVPGALNSNFQFSFGTGAKQANNLYDAKFTLAANATQDLDLNGGGLVNAFDQAFSITKIKVIYIFNASVVDTITFGAAPANPLLSITTLSGQERIPPGAFILKATPDAAGWVVAPGADTVRITNGPTGSTDVYVGILGS